MDVFQAIVLGLVQGATEFLPVSSSGHLRIVPAFAGWEDPGTAFTAVIQLGTMAAVVLYFRADIARIARAWVIGLRDPSHRDDLDFRIGWYIALGTIPICVFGLAFADQIETGARDLYLIGTMLIVLALVLLYAERTSTRERGIDTIGRGDAIAMGFAQACALVPGVSRSGATITAGLLMGFDRVAAARFSFLLSIPAVVLSGLYQVTDIIDGDGAVGVVPTIIATLLAFVSGYAAIAFLLRFLTSNTMTVFVGYRVVLGAAVLVLVGAGVIS